MKGETILRVSFFFFLSNGLFVNHSEFKSDDQIKKLPSFKRNWLLCVEGASRQKSLSIKEKKLSSREGEKQRIATGRKSEGFCFWSSEKKGRERPYYTSPHKLMIIH